MILSCQGMFRTDWWLFMSICFKHHMQGVRVRHTHNRPVRQSFVDSPMYSWFTWAHIQATAWLALCIVALISLSKDPSLDGTFPQFLKYLLVGRHINNYFVVSRHITNTLVLFTTETWQTNYVNARKKCYKQTMFMHTRHNKHTRF